MAMLRRWGEKRGGRVVPRNWNLSSTSARPATVGGSGAGNSLPPNTPRVTPRVTPHVSACAREHVRT
eukprot:631579-Rhodomonas_salina.1